MAEIILAYCRSINRFVDTTDTIIHDISALLPVWKTDAWINDGAQDAIFQTAKNDDVFLVCLNPEEEDALFDFIGYQESFGFKMERIKY